MLNVRNLTKSAIRYHKQHGIASDQLEQTLAAMLSDGYSLSDDIRRRGLHNSYFKEFEAAVNGKKFWTANHVLVMRIVDNYNN